MTGASTFTPREKRRRSRSCRRAARHASDHHHWNSDVRLIPVQQMAHYDRTRRSHRARAHRACAAARDIQSVSCLQGAKIRYSTFRVCSVLTNSCPAHSVFLIFLVKIHFDTDVPIISRGNAKKQFSIDLPKPTLSIANSKPSDHSH